MSDYKLTRDAAGNVTTQYSQMLQRLEDDLSIAGLVKRLRDTNGGWASDEALAAADRIEQLAAACEELEAKLAKALRVMMEAAEGQNDYSPLTGNTVETRYSKYLRKVVAELKGEANAN